MSLILRHFRDISTHGIQVMFDICLEMLPMQNQEDHAFIFISFIHIYTIFQFNNRSQNNLSFSTHPVGWDENIPMLSCLNLDDKALSLGEGWVLMQSRQVPGRLPGFSVRGGSIFLYNLNCPKCRA